MSSLAVAAWSPICSHFAAPTPDAGDQPRRPSYHPALPTAVAETFALCGRDARFAALAAATSASRLAFDLGVVGGQSMSMKTSFLTICLSSSSGWSMVTSDPTTTRRMPRWQSAARVPCSSIAASRGCSRIADPNRAAPSSSILFDLSEIVRSLVSDLSAAHMALADVVLRELYDRFRVSKPPTGPTVPSVCALAKSLDAADPG
mmetsp:Transcript_5258/g.23652  ORF Transcript_5258/g.23652 Transcript_5258/m.23652 type:complete len:204 (-) Transcript_5258:379-990(-)